MTEWILITHVLEFYLNDSKEIDSLFPNYNAGPVAKFKLHNFVFFCLVGDLLFKHGWKVLIISKLPIHWIAGISVLYRNYTWLWLVAISLNLFHNFTCSSRLSYECSYQRTRPLLNHCSHEVYFILYCTRAYFNLRWTDKFLLRSYPTITTLTNLTAYTKRHNEWAQMHPIQLSCSGVNNNFYWSWQQTFSPLMHVI